MSFRIADFVARRYRSWDSDLGRAVEAGTTSLVELERIALTAPEPQLESGRQEWLEAIVQEYL